MFFNLPIIGSSREYRLSPSKIVAVGLNYRAHIAESTSVKVRGMDGSEPDEPVLFGKTPNVLIPSGAPILLPRSLADYPWAEDARTDYEGELVAIMGKTGRHIPESEALDYVFGYTCGNDVSQRNLQNSDRSGWFRGKSFDTFGPLGPGVRESSEIANPQDLKIETRLNGRIVQSSSTGRMIFSVRRIIAFISRQMTLNEGDLIFTGTPEGVGPIRAGDRVEVEIEGIGVLSNPINSESAAR